MIESAYIHIPFCQTICSYCDFCKYYYQEKLAFDYLDALEKEMKSRYQGELLKTIYIGGGTPSALSLTQLKKLLTIVDSFKREKNCEYTVECNVESITEEKIKCMVSHGVNRISIGVETVQPKFLSFLNRHHTKEEVLEKIVMIKKYCQNINIDLIYALPGETEVEVNDDLDFFLSLEVPHISTYSLMIEEHTILYNQGIKPIDDEKDAEMYEQICKKLGEYHHYEISNFAKKGYESKHNLTYWNNLEYYGFGLGASGYMNSIRYTNTRSMNHYLKGKWEYESSLLSEKEKIENEFILGFRKIDGISIASFQEKYHRSPFTLESVKTLLQNHQLQTDGTFLWIPTQYIYVSNDILINFMD